MKRVFSIMGMACGTIVLLVGVYMFFSFKGTYNGRETLSYSFGADYYTEQYSATENAADNILEVGEYLEEIVEFLVRMGSLLVMGFGGVVICYFGCKLAEDSTSTSTMKGREKYKTEEEELPDL